MVWSGLAVTFLFKSEVGEKKKIENSNLKTTGAQASMATIMEIAEELEGNGGQRTCYH